MLVKYGNILIVFNELLCKIYLSEMNWITGKRNLVCGVVRVLRKSYHATVCRLINEQADKTSVQFITHPKGQPDKQKSPYITRYGPQGFVVKGSRVVGSLVVLPGLILHWKVKTAEDITLESLELFTVVDPPLDILVVGTGDKVVKLDHNIHKAMRERGVALEVQDTANACATHNFLLDEGRVTAAALIPPTSLVRVDRTST